MRTRNKAIGIESLAVMIVLILFAFVVFTVIEAGANAYDGIVEDKRQTAGARVAYSYISMKVKQHDAADGVHVVSTELGNTLRVDMGGGFSAFIFYADGALYECVAKTDNSPSVAAANRITYLDGFSVERVGNVLHIECVYEKDDGEDEVVTGTVGIRS